MIASSTQAPTGPGGCVRRPIALLAALALISLPAAAAVGWRNGPRDEPVTMTPSELTRAVTTLASRPSQRRVVVHLDGPLPRVRRAALEAAGLRLLSYLGNHAYFATLTPTADAARLARQPGTVAIEPIDPAHKLHPDLAAGVVHPWARVPDAATGLPASEDPDVAVYVLFHRDFDMNARAEDRIRSFGGTIRSRMTRIHGLVAHLPMHRVAELAGNDDVMYVEPPLPRLSHLNDGNRARTGADVVRAAPYGLDGSGVTVMVYDDGVVAAHPDLAGRLTAGQSGSESSHSTHVACTIGGDAGGPLDGMAPGVSIVSYVFEQEGGLTEGFLYTDPGDLEADYAEAVAVHGVDITNNSIASNVASNGFPCSWEGNYGATGALIDEIARGALGQPLRIVWANGNERQGSAPCGSTYATTPPPACAKNHLTVGALNSNDDSVTSFTSWGPCDDGRLKPDVAAPGCQSDDDGGVTSCIAGGGYAATCGTSMASPTVAGVSALILQQYRLSHPALPDFRNSLLRALLAQTAVDVATPGPDYQSGYGSIRAQGAVDAIIEGRFAEGTVEQGGVRSFTLSVQAGSPVKVTLAWDDPAGMPGVDPVLVNDLDLRIIAPDATVHYPWTLDPADPGALPVQTVRDARNNIEQVQISGTLAGEYLVEIEGFNIAEGPLQPFSVATSQLPVFCVEEPTFAGLEVAAPGGSCGELDLSWSPAQSNCAPPGQVTYNVYRSTEPVFDPTPSTLVHERLSGTAVTDRALDPGSTHYYIVRAEDSRSVEDTNTSVLSATAPIEPDIGAPIFDGLISAAAGPSCGEVLLGWAPAIENCSGPPAYEIHRSTDPLFLPGPATHVATTFGSSFVDTSVEPGTAHTYVVRAKDELDNLDDNDVRLEVTPALFDQEIFHTDFEANDAGWTVAAPNDATTGNWEWGDPEGTPYQPEDDASLSGLNCWITGLTLEPTNGDVDGGTTTLISAPYDLTATVNPEVRYSRWFTNDRGASPGESTDTFRVDGTFDGVFWTPLEEVGAGTPLAWVPVSIPLPIPTTTGVLFRFTAADLGAGSLVEAGIDEFSLFDVGQGCSVCETPPQTLCSTAVARSGDDIMVSWSATPAGMRAVVYAVSGCGPLQPLRLGSTVGTSFLHESAALSSKPFNYRVTFVDACGNELPLHLCGLPDCPP